VDLGTSGGVDLHGRRQSGCEGSGGGGVELRAVAATE
jgi:hypothetical protein